MSNIATVDIEKLRNAYWRMDDALDGLQAGLLPSVMNEVWTAHSLLWDVLKNIDPDILDGTLGPSSLTTSAANNND